MRYDLSAIKARLPQMLEKLGCQPRLTGDRIIAYCPLHDDNQPSFKARIINDAWVWKCWPCDLGGDGIDLAAYYFNAPLKSAQAIKEAAELSGQLNQSKILHCPIFHQKRMNIPCSKSRPKTPLPANFETIHRVARCRVYDSPLIQEIIASEFGVTTETIEGLCFTSDSIGWSTKFRRPLYLYEHGIKIRHHVTAKIRFQWLIGRPELPWRAHYMKRPGITRVYLTEGESDTIALLNAGLECLFPQDGEIGTTIVASPGTSFKAEWAPLFTGKDLVICPDNDLAGERSAEKIADLCHPFTNSISRFKWNANTQDA
jgi:hypothetical protein